MSKDKRKIYRVAPHEDGWRLKADDSQRATGIFKTQAEAIARGSELARSQEPSQLVIQGRDGRIKGESTYGDDPYPPAG